MMQDMEPMRDQTTWVLVTRSCDLPGQWVGHCLNLDVVSQGDSIEHAFQMVQEAVQFLVEEDVQAVKKPKA